MSHAPTTQVRSDRFIGSGSVRSSKQGHILMSLVPARRLKLVAIVQFVGVALCLPALILPDFLPSWSITASLVGLAFVPALVSSSRGVHSRARRWISPWACCLSPRA